MWLAKTEFRFRKRLNSNRFIKRLMKNYRFLFLCWLLVVSPLCAQNQNESNTRDGNLQPGYLGIVTQKSKDGKSLVVMASSEGFPAKMCRVQPGDLIYKIDGVPVSQMADPQKQLEGAAGTFAILTKYRYQMGGEQEVRVPRIAIKPGDKDNLPEEAVSVLIRTDDYKDLASCLINAKMQAMSDPDVDLYRYKTYDFKYASSEDPLTEKQLFKLLGNHLFGMTRNQEHPDLLIEMSFQSGVDTKVSLKFLDAAKMSAAIPPVIWNASVTRHHNATTQEIDWAETDFSLLMDQFPFLWRPRFNGYLLHSYSYTGIFYNQQNMQVIADVIPGSPADQAGLKKGDRIVKINKCAVGNAFAPVKSKFYSLIIKENSGLQYLFVNSGLMFKPFDGKEIRNLTFEVKREKQKMSFTVTPVTENIFLPF
jgi:hypothetical protein